MNFTTPKFGGNESWKKLFWMQYNSESICMCWKHKTKTAQCHCGIIFFNVGWNCAALVWASIVANLSLSCNRFFLVSPLHDLPLIIKWHLIRKNSALFKNFLEFLGRFLRKLGERAKKILAHKVMGSTIQGFSSGIKVLLDHKNPRINTYFGIKKITGLKIAGSKL